MSTEDVPPIIWLTRDRTGGELDDHVEIWSVSPERHRSDDGDVMWLAPLAFIDGHSVMNLGDISVAQARIKYGPGTPETDMECTCVARTFNTQETVRS